MQSHMSELKLNIATLITMEHVEKIYGFWKNCPWNVKKTF
jgi:hypothetical protein